MFEGVSTGSGFLELSKVTGVSDEPAAFILRLQDTISHARKNFICGIYLILVHMFRHFSVTDNKIVINEIVLFCFILNILHISTQYVG